MLPRRSRLAPCGLAVLLGAALSSLPAPASSMPIADIRDVAGSYQGSWLDETFVPAPNPNATGAFSLDVAITGDDAVLTFVIGGFPFVGRIPIDFEFSLPGTVVGNQILLSKIGDPFLGDISGSINDDGTLTAMLGNLPEPGTGDAVDMVNIGGTISVGAVNVVSLDFEVIHDPRLQLPNSFGTLTASTSVPEPVGLASLALLATGLACLRRGAARVRR